MKRLEGYVAVVTGGARGIGKSICELFAAQGARTAVTDILDNEGMPLVKEIQDKGGQAKYFHLDTSREEQVKEVLAQVNDKFGGIQVLLNNAGITGPNKPTHEIELEEFRKNLDMLHPIGHVGESLDIAYGALYLASAESKFVTGSELVIDGGYTAQ